MVREIILDTETTGLDPAKGDRIVEVGAVELLNHLPTGRTFMSTSIPSATCRRKRRRYTAFPALS